ncbi:unnamed protein product [Amoebophrya sp. A25]|nr:unnamed protein product [Amoebophrya sp. A25]|eukprot:GSA25T00025829001.1
MKSSTSASSSVLASNLCRVSDSSSSSVVKFESSAVRVVKLRRRMIMSLALRLWLRLLALLSMTILHHLARGRRPYMAGSPLVLWLEAEPFTRSGTKPSVEQWPQQLR